MTLTTRHISDDERWVPGGGGDDRKPQNVKGLKVV